MGMKRYLPELLFVFSLLSFGFMAGIFVMQFKVFPYGLLQSAYRDTRAMMADWEGFFGMRPSAPVLARARRGGSGAMVLDQDAMAGGLTLMSGCPEAFEEIIWLSFWGGTYHADCIEPWSRKDWDAEFEGFWRSHIGIIVALRRGQTDDPRCPHYVSKNNANIARLGLLEALFPGCSIVIPVRNAWDQIESLRRQHKRFKTIHGDDRFSLRSMEWLGHFDFGDALRPIDFAHWLREGSALDPLDAPFWLTYWAAANEAVLAAAGPRVHFFDYDRACAEPEPMLRSLAALLDLDDPSALLAQARPVPAPDPLRRSLGQAAAPPGKPSAGDP